MLISDALEDSGLYDEQTGFFYDRLTDAAGNSTTIDVQTLVGIIPVLPAVSVPWAQVERLTALRNAVRVAPRRPRRTSRGAGRRPAKGTPGGCSCRWSARQQGARVLARLLDENSFLSPHGLRSVSKRAPGALRRPRAA